MDPSLLDWKLVVAVLALLLALAAFRRDRARISLRMSERDDGSLLLHVLNRGRRPVAILDVRLSLSLGGFPYSIAPSGIWRYSGDKLRHVSEPFGSNALEAPITLNEERPSLFLYVDSSRIRSLRAHYPVRVLALWAADTSNHVYLRCDGPISWILRYVALRRWNRLNFKYFLKYLEILRHDDPDRAIAVARSAVQESPWRRYSDEQLKRDAGYAGPPNGQYMMELVEWRRLLRELSPNDLLLRERQL